MSTGESSSARAALLALALAAIACGALALLPARGKAAEETPCGSVKGEFEISIAKGNVSCADARHAAKRFLVSRHCGDGKEPACVDEGFRCRLASFNLQDHTGIAGFCYTLLHPLPPSRDLSKYELDLFKTAFVIRLGE